MNKTVKTIAWICLVLGLLGIAIDVGLYVRARTFAAQIAEKIEAGDIPVMGRRFDDGDEDESADGFRMRPGKGDDQLMPAGGFNPIRRGMGGYRPFNFGLPLFFLAAGPVLAVVGGVMLIVNREPDQQEPQQKLKNEKKAKKE
jgi:hypothetical protein